MISRSELFLFICFFIIWVFIFLFNSEIEEAHISEFIYWISSDAPVYYNNMDNFQLDSFFSNPQYFVNLMPIFIYNIFDGMQGYLLFVSVIGFFVIRFSLKFIERKYRVFYICFLMIFPYVSLGFFSINKEIFSLLSAILFSCYYKDGKLATLFFACVLAFFARSYLLLSFLFVVFFVPVNGCFLRWRFFIFFLLLISVFPYFISDLNGFDANYGDNAGFTAIFTSKLIHDGFYFIIYFLKYFLLLTSKFYQAFNVGFDFSGRVQDFHEFIVSFITLIIFSLSIYCFCMKKKSRKDKRYIYMALVSPVIVMFSDIFHWRYASFVYIFYLFYLFSSKDLSSKDN